MSTRSEESPRMRVRFANQPGSSHPPRSASVRTELPVLRPSQKLDIESLRYPTEKGFLIAIYVFNAIVFLGIAAVCVFQPIVLLFIAGAVLFLYLMNKLTWVLFYWFLYGNSVKVSESQYPEVHRAVRLACDYIDLKPFPTVFVLSGNGLLEIFMIKRFSKKGVLLFTSELIDNLLDAGDSRQLMMLIGRQLGRIKLGHYKGWIFKDGIGALTLWLHQAWQRRCHYSADRVGFLVAGNLDAARRALLTLTVGKKLALATRIEAIKDQEDDLRSSFFAWLAEGSQAYPFLIRRVVELESFQDRVLERPYNSVAQEEVAALPPEVSRFQIINVHGQAIFGDRGVISVQTA